MTAAMLAGQLAPVKAAILAAARRDAERYRAVADEAVRRTLADASQRARAVLAAARQDGAAEAAALLAASQARAADAARAAGLNAGNEAYAALRMQARAAVAALSEDPAVRRNMAAVVRSALGADTQLQVVPDGVVGEAHGRRVRCSLRLLADRAVDEVLAEEVP